MSAPGDDRAMPRRRSPHSHDAWKRVWDLWLGTDVEIREIAEKTGISQARISSRAKWVRQIDETFPSGRDRERARTLRLAADESRLNAPGLLGQVRRTRARQRGLDVPLRKNGLPVPPAELLQAIDDALAAGKRARQIADETGEKLPRIQGILYRRKIKEWEQRA